MCKRIYILEAIIIAANTNAVVLFSYFKKRERESLNRGSEAPVTWRTLTFNLQKHFPKHSLPDRRVLNRRPQLCVVEEECLLKETNKTRARKAASSEAAIIRRGGLRKDGKKGHEQGPPPCLSPWC